jgi:hypothetical protein
MSSLSSTGTAAYGIRSWKAVLASVLAHDWSITLLSCFIMLFTYHQGCSFVLILQVADTPEPCIRQEQ